MYPWQAPASFFPHLEALNASISTTSLQGSLGTSTSMASTSTSMASTSTPVASTSTVVSAPESASASGSVPAKEKKKEKETRAERRKLPEQASNVLKDYCTNITITPTPAQRRELLKLIQTIPGAEWYSTEHISRWFLSRRQAAKNQNQGRKREGEGDDVGVLVGSEGVRKRGRRRREGGGGGGVMTSANILWPTLTPEKITKLTILLREHSTSSSNSPHPPNEGVLEVWARALRAEKDDVWNWVQMNSLGSGSGSNSASTNLNPSLVAIKSLPSPTSTSPSSAFPSPTVTVKQEPPSQPSNLKMSLYSPTESHAPLLLDSPVERKPVLPISNAPSTLTLSSTSTSEEPPTTALETTTKQPRIPYETTRFKVSMLPPLSLSIPGSGSPMLLPPSQLVRDLAELVQLPTPVEPVPPSRPDAILSPVEPVPPSRSVPLAITSPVEPAPVEPASVEPAPVEPAPVEPAPVEPAPVEPAPLSRPVPIAITSPVRSSPTNAQTSQEELIPLPRPATRSPVIAQTPQFAITPTISSPDVDAEVEVGGLIPLPRPATRSPVIVQTFQGFGAPQTPQGLEIESNTNMSTVSILKAEHDMDVDVRPTNSPQGPATVDSPSPPTLLQKSPESPSLSLPEVPSPSHPHPPAAGTIPHSSEKDEDSHRAMIVESAAEAEVESSGDSSSSASGLGTPVNSEATTTKRNDVNSIPSDVPMDLESPSEPTQPPVDATTAIHPSPPPSPALAHPTWPHPSPSPSNPSSPSMTDANAPHSETTTSIVNPTLSINHSASAPDVPMDLGAPSDHAHSESESGPTLSASPSSEEEDMDLSSPSPSPSTPTSELHYPHDHEPSCTRTRNRLAELAVFVDQRLSCSHSQSPDDCNGANVMEEFSESLRTSEVFFEKIRSGVYSELGLVLRELDD